MHGSKESPPKGGLLRARRSSCAGHHLGHQFFLARHQLLAHGHEVQTLGGTGLGEHLVALFLHVVVDVLAEHLHLGIEHLVDVLGFLDLSDEILGARVFDVTANGRTIVNNKGRPVKQYAPYFSAEVDFEDDPALVETGVSALQFYDPLGRPTRGELPNGTTTRAEFGTWWRAGYDSNDTVLPPTRTSTAGCSPSRPDAPLAGAWKDDPAPPPAQWPSAACGWG